MDLSYTFFSLVDAVEAGPKKKELFCLTPKI